MSERVKITIEEDKIVNKTYDEVVVNKRWQNFKSETYKEYRNKWRRNPETFTVEDFPIHLDLEITNYCNLKCPMCSRTIQIENGEFDELKHMDLALFKKIIDEGSEEGLYSVKFNYLGEPLMHPDVVEMVRYCKEKGIIDVMFNTNAVLLNEKMCKDLLEAGIDGIFISVDSDVTDEFNAIRVGTTYEKVAENVRLLSRVRESDERYFKTQIRISKILFPTDTEDTVQAFIENWTPYVDTIGIGALIDFEKEVVGVKENVRCDQPWQRLFVSAHGQIFPCCLDNYKEYVVGNAFTDSIQSVWKGEMMKQLRHAHQSGCYYNIEICKKCRYVIESGLIINKG